MKGPNLGSWKKVCLQLFMKLVKIPNTVNAVKLIPGINELSCKKIILLLFFAVPSSMVQKRYAANNTNDCWCEKSGNGFWNCAGEVEEEIIFAIEQKFRF